MACVVVRARMRGGRRCRQEALRRRLQRFNSKYGIMPPTRTVDAPQSTASARTKTLDPQAALLQAQKNKEQAQQELRVLMKELEEVP